MASVSDLRRTYQAQSDNQEVASEQSAMGTKGEDKKVQLPCKLAVTAAENVERKASPGNPYNLSGCSKSGSKECEDVDDNRISDVNSLAELYSLLRPKSQVNSDSPEQISVQSSLADNDPASTKSRYEGAESHWSRIESYRKIKAKVERAIKRHKIFLIRGELPRLKEALEERGWVQKYECTRTRGLPYGSGISLDSSRSLGDLVQQDETLNERAAIFALLRHKSPDFIWDCRNDFVEWHHGVSNDTILNRYEKPFIYTSKLGMARLLEDAHWYFEKGVSSVSFPRSYNLSRDPKAFVEDFRATAASGLLKWFVQRMQETRDIADQGHRAIPMSRLEFAIKRCEEFIAQAEHRNIDEDVVTEISEDEWNLFLADYMSLLHEGNGIQINSDESRERLQRLFAEAVSILTKLKAVDPQYELNGMRNTWILKPSNLCCGTGISISHDLKEIFRRVRQKSKNYFVIQKYIERPLLIQGTKFDIRQWYLVTSSYPLTIWLFKEGLLRFSSRPYTFSTYHEAIHICNTAIQEKYDEERRRRRKRAGYSEEVVKSIRDQGWDCEKLNEYLKAAGFEGEPYYDRIYCKMGEAIVLTMLAAQEHMDRRHCSFELYGADFVVTEDLSVWLIEINTNPRMHPPSSKLAKRLYSAVLESVVKGEQAQILASLNLESVKVSGLVLGNQEQSSALATATRNRWKTDVVLDLPANPRADTGGFELFYKQSVPEFRGYLGPCLFVFGKSIALREAPRRREKKGKQPSSSNARPGIHLQAHRAATAPPTMPTNREPRIVDFIDCLKTAPWMIDT